MSALARRVAVHDLVAAYGHHLDAEDYQSWLDLFASESSYRVTPRENVDQGLPLNLMLCETKKALTDRVVSLLKANRYRPFTVRHVTSPPFIVADDGSAVQACANYALYQSDADGHVELFSVGRYDFRLAVADDRATIASAAVIVDSFLIPTLLVKPI